jgi:hypothetical protein
MISIRTGIARASTLAALWLGSIQYASADPILVHHPATAPGGSASQQSPNTNYVAGDDFTLDTGAFVTGVLWQGAFSSEPPSDITQFAVTFWNDSDGLPGMPLQTYTFPGNAGQTFGGPGLNDFLEYDYGVTLPTPFVAHNGVTSWISVQPTTDFAPQPQWYWRQSGGPGTGYSASAGSGGSQTFLQTPGDLAFTLNGTTFDEPPPPTLPTPEPSTLVLLGSALTVSLRARCCRSAQRSR